MKTISLSCAIRVLAHCVAVRASSSVSSKYVTFPLVEANATADNFFLVLMRDPRGEEETFKPNDNETVRVTDAGEMILMNADGEEVKVLPLIGAPVVG